jgi:hypothetical protein
MSGRNTVRSPAVRAGPAPSAVLSMETSAAASVKLSYLSLDAGRASGNTSEAAGVF